MSHATLRSAVFERTRAPGEDPAGVPRRRAQLVFVFPRAEPPRVSLEEAAALSARLGAELRVVILERDASAGAHAPAPALEPRASGRDAREALGEAVVEIVSEERGTAIVERTWNVMNEHDDDAPPSSSAVRSAALTWHADVRRELARGLAAIRAVRVGDADGPSRLRAAAASIAIVVRRQIHAEAAQLAPVLESLDAWGPQRVELLASAHAAEKEALGPALRRDVSTSEQADALESAIRAILVSLRLEEQELLDPDLLDDTTIVNPWQGGS